MRLSHTNLGLAFRELIYRDFKSATEAANAIDVDPCELRRCWAKSDDSNVRRVSMSRLVAFANRLGYNITFTIERTGHTNEQRTDRILHEAATSKGCSVYNGS